MRKIPPNESWGLSCNYDEYGYECLNLRIGEEEHCVCESEYCTDSSPKLDSGHVGEYFTEVVKTVFEIVIKNAPEYLDLAKIQEQVMEPLWQEWKEHGYVDDE